MTVVEIASKKRRTNWIIVIVFVMAIAVVSAWASGLKRHIFPRHWQTVNEGLVYRSGELSTTLVERTWRKHNIQTVISLMGPEGDDPDCEAAARDAAGELHIERKMFPLIGDGTGDVEQYVQAVKALVQSRNAGKPVVVHCATGTYRTGGAIAIYRTLIEGWTGKQAYHEMITEGVKPGPNTPITLYLNTNIGTIARRLAEEGVIEQMPDPLPVFGP
jgi:predicted protein tyrosine phosphatase